MTKNRILITLGVWPLIIAGCSGPQTGSAGNGGPEYPGKSGGAQSSLPDPSLKKCIDDGYDLMPIKKGGIVQSYLCVNPATRQKCDSWLYYRGECSLTNEAVDEVKPPIKFRKND